MEDKEVVVKKENTLKKWYQSKTILLGFAAVAVAVAQTLSENFDYKTALIAALGAVSIYLRTLTNQGVTK